MKSSLRKLRGFAMQQRQQQVASAAGGQAAAAAVQHDELLAAAQEMQGMRNCYDSLLAAAAATANSAYEFKEALREMGTCLLEKIAPNEDSTSGKVLLMLGKAQFELLKLVDGYRVHVLQTITTPSQSLLKELQTVEEMKIQCDHKRELYDYMLTAYREKGRFRQAKAENICLEQLKQAQEDYQEEATLFLFRLKSLKQGQFRSLLTQAARHHAAQLNLFRKGLQSLEQVEPHVKLAAEEHHIDYQFSGLEDDDDGEDENNVSLEDSYDGELSFDYGLHDEGSEVDHLARNPMEEFPERNLGDFSSFSAGGQIPASQSAPLLAERKLEPVERMKELRRSATRKLHAYVLPTPSDDQGASLSGSGTATSGTLVESKSDWHSSPLHPNVKDFRENKLPSPARSSTAQSVLKESNINSVERKVVPPLSEGLALPNYTKGFSDTKKVKREAFSGPIVGKSGSVENLNLVGTRPMHTCSPQPISALKIAPSASPPPVSSPIFNELHELPLPPANFSKYTGQPSLIAYSAPLVPRGQDYCTTSKMPQNTSQTASPLPTPPVAIARSFSIPSRNPRTPRTSDAKVMDVLENSSSSIDMLYPHISQESQTSSLPLPAASGSVNQVSKT